ncbi:unnamed protein product, partial [Brenthis ino]
MTNKFSAKFLEIFKNLKSDAVPRPPRQRESFSSPETPPAESFNENVTNSHNQEDQFGEQNDSKKKNKKPKFKKSFSAPPMDTPEDEEDKQRSNGSNVNTQASGNVINIVNSKNVRCGNEIVYYMGPVYGQPSRSKTPPSDDDNDEPIVKTNLIVLLLEANQKVEHEYMDYISKNLGKNWHNFFRRLGYTQGQIETAEIDMAKYGIAEARYKLLLDWVRNDDDGTLGKLARILWDDGERQMVKELAALYSDNK